MNKAILIGRLTRDPEVRYTQSGVAVCTFTLAVDRRFARRDANDGQPTADFIPIVTWRKLAEICGNYEAQDGSKRYVTEIVADEIEFLDSRNSASHEGGFGGAPAPQQPPQSKPTDAGSFGPSIPDEEIPF